MALTESGSDQLTIFALLSLENKKAGVPAPLQPGPRTTARVPERATRGLTPRRSAPCTSVAMDSALPLHGGKTARRMLMLMTPTDSKP